MKALRIVLTQNSANYRKEETVINKMTYPLPTPSMIIGAIHNACNYTEYRPMDISIQGSYESMHMKPYTDYCFLNSIQDDRGMLVKFKNNNTLSTSFEKVAKAVNSQGNSFLKGITIDVYREDLLKEYRELKELKSDIDLFKKNRLNTALDLIKKRKKTLTNRKKAFKENKEKLLKIKERDMEIKALEKDIKNRFSSFITNNYEAPLSRFRCVTTSLKYYEILNNIELVIHVRVDNEETLKEITDNIYNMKSIGRSEDFVDIKEVKVVELKETSEEIIKSENSSYLDFDMVREWAALRENNINSVNGTKYLLNKNYNIENNKRVFNKVKVLYTSGYQLGGEDDIVDNVYFDLEDEEKYIVNFL